MYGSRGEEEEREEEEACFLSAAFSHFLHFCRHVTTAVAGKSQFPHQMETGWLGKS